MIIMILIIIIITGSTDVNLADKGIFLRKDSHI
jgi:hypothetical protein